MYKNTVVQGGLEASTVVRVVAPGETREDAAEHANRLAGEGIKTLIFPSDEMLRVWRLRLAALA